MINRILRAIERLMKWLYPMTSTDNETVITVSTPETTAYKPQISTSTPEPKPILTIEETTPQKPIYDPVELLWDTPQNAKHSIRLICDEEGLTFEQKNTMCATIGAESGYKTTARLDNKDKQGRIWSTDWGICQWNDYWHGKEISPEEAVNNPEKAVRLMCQYWKRGQRTQWVAYLNGSYKRYL